MFSQRPCFLASTSLHLMLVLLSLPALSTAAFTNDFSDYPSGTRTCLGNAADSSGCTGDTSAEMNSCLCGNGGDFVTSSARCIAQSDVDDMESTWEIMELHCSESNTPLSISKAQFLAYESGVSSSSSASSTATSTATSTSTPTSTGSQQTATSTPTSTPDAADDDEGQGDGLSTGAKAGVIAGSAVAGVALLAAALLFFIRRRKRRQQQYQYSEVHPMLNANAPNGSSSSGGPGGGSSGYPTNMTMGPSELEGGASTANSTHNRNTWQSSSDGSSVPWSPGAFDSVNVAELQSPHQPPPLPQEIYEMPGDSVAPLSPPAIPVEMPSIAVKSPVVSPSTSRYSGADWASEPSEMSRYEPFRSP